MKVNGADYSSFASAKSFEYPEEFINVAHPQEPHDVDRPIRCPPPEPCIVHVRISPLHHCSALKSFRLLLVLMERLQISRTLVFAAPISLGCIFKRMSLYYGKRRRMPSRWVTLSSFSNLVRFDVYRMPV